MNTLFGGGVGALENGEKSDWSAVKTGENKSAAEHCKLNPVRIKKPARSRRMTRMPTGVFVEFRLNEKKANEVAARERENARRYATILYAIWRTTDAPGGYQRRDRPYDAKNNP